MTKAKQLNILLANVEEKSGSSLHEALLLQFETARIDGLEDFCDEAIEATIESFIERSIDATDDRLESAFEFRNAWITTSVIDKRVFIGAVRRLAMNAFVAPAEV